MYAASYLQVYNYKDEQFGKCNLSDIYYYE